MFENKMDCKDVHVLKKSTNPDSPLRVQVPGKGNYANVFPERNIMHHMCIKYMKNLDFDKRKICRYLSLSTASLPSGIMAESKLSIILKR